LFDCFFSRREPVVETGIAGATKLRRPWSLYPPVRCDEETPDAWDPSADFIFAPAAHAVAAPLAIVNAMAATRLSNRLDIGSPPFCKSGTCRAWDDSKGRARLH
jgi:hypothetical protein